VENVLAGFFYTQHNIRLNSDVFDRLNRMGKLLLIFDGFDEMADKIDTQKMTDNFWELAKVVTPNAKVILTCRTEHFPTAQDGRENFGGERIPSTTNKIAIAPKFETLELLKFDDEQIREVLSRRTNSATVELVMANAQLLDLLQRAVMAEFVLEALPEIEAGKPIDLARVYLYAVRHKMERDITTGRTFTSLADKLYFLCELAWEMLSEDKMSINYREFPDRLRVLFKNEAKEQKHLDHWHYDMMGQTMLIRNDDGDYSPAHRSLLEFFVAYKFAAELGLLADDFLEMAQAQSGIDESLEPQFYTWSSYWRRDVDDKGDRKLIAPLAGFMQEPLEKLQDNFGKKPLTKALLDLLLPSLSLGVKYQNSNLLLELIKSTKASEDGYLGGNAATVLGKINLNALEYQDLRDTNLAYSNLVNVGLIGTNLSGANLENCITTSMFSSVCDIIISKDDRQVIAAHDNTIRIWDRVSRREIKRLTGHKDSVLALALSMDGQRIYSASEDNTIKEWNLTDGKYLRTFEGHKNSVYQITLSIDGHRIYSGSHDCTIKEWNLVDGKCLRTFEGHQDWMRAITLSRDGKHLYSASENQIIKEWNLANGKCQHTFESRKSSVWALALSIDGKRLYSSGNNNITEWNLADGKCLRIFEGHQANVDVLVMSQDGQWLYSGSDDCTIKEWDLVDGKCLRTLKGHKDRIGTIALSGDGQWLYSGGRTIKEWNLSDSICHHTWEGHKSSSWNRALSVNGQRLYCGSTDTSIKEWNLVDGKCLRTFEGNEDPVNTIVLSRDGQWLYSGSQTIKEWNLSDSSFRTLEGHQERLRAIVLSSDGQFLYSGSNDGTIKEWSLKDGICRRTFEEEGPATKITLSSDGQFLYSVGDSVIKEWNLKDGICRRTFEGGNQSSVNAIVLSRDGQFLYSGGGYMIKEWNLEDGSCWRTFKGHHSSSVNRIKLSDNGQRLYSGSYDDTVQEWNLADGKCLRTWEGHKDSIWEIALYQDRQLIFSFSSDNMIKEWDVETGKCLRTIDTRLCAGANITNVKGLTRAQTDALLALGAFSAD
jgi:WD40 repeat protein